MSDFKAKMHRIRFRLGLLLRFWQFLKVYISQGSAATRFGCGEIFDDCFIANFPESVTVKEF